MGINIDDDSLFRQLFGKAIKEKFFPIDDNVHLRDKRGDLIDNEGLDVETRRAKREKEFPIQVIFPYKDSPHKNAAARDAQLGHLERFFKVSKMYATRKDEIVFGRKQEGLYTKMQIEKRRKRMV